jgi:hypothetical protein
MIIHVHARSQLPFLNANQNDSEIAKILDYQHEISSEHIQEMEAHMCLYMVVSCEFLINPGIGFLS